MDSNWNPRKQPANVPAREPRVANQLLPSLARLGNDIMAMIMEMIDNESPQTIPSVALVCSYCYALARYSQHRNVAIDMTNNENAEKKLKYLEKTSVLPAIRHLVVRGGTRDGRDSARTKLLRLLYQMTGLRELTWTCSKIPKDIIGFICQKPRLRFHFYIMQSDVTVDLVHDSLTCLQGNQNLHSLHVHYTYSSAEECCKVTQPLKQALLSCSNLRRLTVDISLKRTGYLAAPPFREYCGLGFVDGECPPPLEDLEVVAYPFGARSEDTEAALRSPFRQVGYPLKGLEQDYWAETFDWTRLRRLVTVYAAFALKIMPMLTSLREVKLSWLDHQHDQRHIREFCEQVPAALESIAVPTVASVGLRGLTSHGPTLKNLEIHQDEYFQTGLWGEDAASADMLCQIRDGCPHIEVLALDVDRRGAWPYAILDILASFPRLRELKIWFALGFLDPDAPLNPYLTASAAQKLFTYIRRKSPRQPSPLRRLELVSGSPPASSFGQPSTWVLWAHCNSTSFISTLSERDDEAAKVIYKFRCPKLPADANRYLQDLETLGDECYEYTGSVTQDFQVARDGPTSISEVVPR